MSDCHDDLSKNLARWLLRNGHSDKARRAISRLSGHPIDEPLVEHEFQMIEASLEAEGRSSYVSLFKPRQENKILRRTLTCMALQGLQQLTGINFVSPIVAIHFSRPDLLLWYHLL